MKNIWILLMTLAAAVSCAQNNTQPGDRCQKNTSWTLSREGSTESYEAAVPSTVAGVLSEAGRFGDDLLEGQIGRAHV